MKKLIRHVKEWNKWRKNSLNSSMHKLLVLIGFRRSPTFKLMRDWDRATKSDKLRNCTLVCGKEIWICQRRKSQGRSASSRTSV